MSDALRDDYEENRRYTYADYLTWEGPERYQLINGEVFQMASPTVVHQAILRELSTQFSNWLSGKPCQVFFAPLDVRLFPKKDKSDKTVLQPDLLVICDKNKIAKNSIDGAPDLIVDIISPSDTYSEWLLKYSYFLKAGVKEYWVINPEVRKAQVHVYENEHYISTGYDDNDSISVSVLPGLEIPLKSIFENA